jgi:hypothetical protein
LEPRREGGRGPAQREPKGGLVISDLFAMELLDEVSGRSIKHSYTIAGRMPR